ncbi:MULTISPECIES: fatty acid oxidation complex subunit alpha FadB [Pseudomonas]|uniref:fatty acid oxidation complex subunit alpha FadB n=1 Tax=Pseudomonas nitroreducens TaxID=46680 RepID=UPI001E57507A|nr:MULTISPECIES: fatty acid oxidation complex subunit alpha FadB [Pseudomonas]MCE4071478.1 fatty acid oxidation complex subunit alpha FadB [Pseudomonas nitritireducens]MCE4081254.1 fatty acid oxidation complex subunit alpha FadB [Pseudomonas nitroreducens]
MFQGQSLSLSPLESGLVELRFDRQGSSVNTLDELTLNELGEALGLLRTAAGVQGLLLTSAKDSFIVGADLNELAVLLRSEVEEIARVNGGQSAVISQLEELPFPTLVMLDGMALGGGFELTLACDYRIASPQTLLGLPEIGLGLFPALGGSVRLPRLLDEAVALAWITSARPQKAEAALAAGALDGVVEGTALRQAALLELFTSSRNDTWKARRRQRLLPREQSQAQVYADARTASAGSKVPALSTVISLVEQSIHLDRDGALRLESAAFSRVLKSQAAAALVQVFHNEQLLKRRAREYGRIASRPGSAGVLGAGIMGGGIAYTSAVRGVPVVMKDIAAGALDLGMAEARKLLDKQVASQRLSAEKADAILGQIQPTLGYPGFPKLDVVVEAVVENLTVKKQVLAEVESQVGTHCVLASNTSSLSITELASALQRPQQFVGMHFFNPVPAMPLVEVICGPNTSQVAAATIASYASAMGKTPVVVRDCPGFLVNRILTAYILAFLRLVHDGADFRRVDRVMEGFGWPMGPAYLQDVVGMDTSSHVIEHIAHGYGERLLPGYEHAVQRMASLGRFGQKNGIGFYRYETDTKGRPRKLDSEDTNSLLAEIQPNGRREFSDEEITQRMMLPLIIEASRCLEEDVAASAGEVDMALILGVGLPRHLGGALVYADWLGMSEVLNLCCRYTNLGGLYEPSPRMREMAAQGRSYYQQ